MGPCKKNPFSAKWSGIFWQPVDQLTLGDGRIHQANKHFLPGDNIDSFNLLNDINVLYDRICDWQLDYILDYAWKNHLTDGLSKCTLFASARIVGSNDLAEEIKKYFLKGLDGEQAKIYRIKLQEIDKNFEEMYVNLA